MQRGPRQEEREGGEWVKIDGVCGVKLGELGSKAQGGKHSTHAFVGLLFATRV